MDKFVLLVIAAVLVLGLLMFGGAEFLRTSTAAQIADANARVAEANAIIAQAEAWASVENTEEMYDFASPLLTGGLVLVAVVVGMVAFGIILALIFGGVRGWMQ